MDGDQNENIENNESGYKIPLGLCKQAIMKLESAITDICEIKEDDDLNSEDKQTMEGLVEILGQCTAVIVNMVGREMDEDEFLSEDIAMDEIDPYPGEEDNNLLDRNIDE